MNTIPTYPAYPEFTHYLDLHKYIRPRHGYKMFFVLLGFGGFFFLLCPVKILSDRNDHLPLDYGTVGLWFFGIAFLFGALAYFPLCQQAKPNKAILWLPAQDKNSQPCLHIRSQNRSIFLGYAFFFFCLLGAFCVAYDLESLSPSQVLQPWNWIRTMPFNMKLDIANLGTDFIFIALIFFILLFPRWHIIYTPNYLHIYRNLPLLARTITTLHTPWEQIATVNLIQYTPNYPHTSTITLKDGQEKTVKLSPAILADPCWMNFIAHTLINLPNTPSRQNFLINLHQYVPPNAKTRYTKP